MYCNYRSEHCQRKNCSELLNKNTYICDKHFEELQLPLYLQITPDLQVYVDRLEEGYETLDKNGRRLLLEKTKEQHPEILKQKLAFCMNIEWKECYEYISKQNNSDVKILNKDILGIIFKDLSKKDLLTLSATCKYFKNICDEYTRVSRYDRELFKIFNDKIMWFRIRFFLDLKGVNDRGKDVEDNKRNLIISAKNLYNERWKYVYD